MTDACQRYLEDPEGHAGHLAVCEKCRAMEEILGSRVHAQPIRVDALPLAPWEQAAYRAWPVVIGGMLAVLAVAFAICRAAGISPLTAIVAGMSAAQMRAYETSAADALRGASLAWQIVFGAAFVVINAVLVVLLRRAPRGIDA